MYNHISYIITMIYFCSRKILIRWNSTFKCHLLLLGQDIYSYSEDYSFKIDAWFYSHKKSNLYENANDQELQSNPEQREFYRIYHCTWLQVILLSYSNTNSMGLV